MHTTAEKFGPLPWTVKIKNTLLSLVGVQCPKPFIYKCGPGPYCRDNRDEQFPCIICKNAPEIILDGQYCAHCYDAEFES